MYVYKYVCMSGDSTFLLSLYDVLFFVGNQWNYNKFVSYKDMLSKILSVYPTAEKIDDQMNDTSKVYIHFYCLLVKS